MDPACRFPYEANNSAKFVERDISKVSPSELNALFGNADLKILAGCAPCQPFSSYAQRYELDGKDGKWGLLYEFARLSEGTRPDVITMENVPTVAKHKVFHDFVDTLKRLGYNVWFDVVDSSQYGVPQTRRRMVLLASRHGMSLIDHTTRSRSPRRSRSSSRYCRHRAISSDNGTRSRGSRRSTRYNSASDSRAFSARRGS